MNRKLYETMNEQIKYNLKTLFDNNYQNLLDNSIKQTIESIIADFSDMPIINLDKTISIGLDKEEMEKLVMAKNNAKLASKYNKIKQMRFDEQEIITGLKNDIIESVKQIKKAISSDSNNFKNQLIFLDSNHYYHSCFCGFGTGNYPVLKKPDFFEYNHNSKIYLGVGKIDYSKIYTNLIEFNEILESLDIYDFIADNKLYEIIKDVFKYKTYLFLSEAFEQLGVKVFDEIEIKKPLFIYGNEYHYGSLNIYTFE